MARALKQELVVTGVRSHRTHLNEIAGRCFSDCEGDVDAASRQMVSEVQDDPSLMRELLGDLLLHAAKRFMTWIASSNRGSIKRGEGTIVPMHGMRPARPGPNARTGQDAVSRGLRLFTLQFQGKLLFQLERTDLELALATSTNRAAGYQKNAKMFRWLIDRVRPGKTVGQCVDAGEFETLMDRLHT